MHLMGYILAPPVYTIERFTRGGDAGCRYNYCSNCYFLSFILKWPGQFLSEIVYFLVHILLSAKFYYNSRLAFYLYIYYTILWF